MAYSARQPTAISLRISLTVLQPRYSTNPYLRASSDMSALRFVAMLLVAAVAGWAGAALWYVPSSGAASADATAARPVSEPKQPAPIETTVEAPTAPTTDTSTAANPLLPKEASSAPPDTELELADLEALLAALPAAERDQWLVSVESLSRLAEEEAALRSTLKAAAANHAVEDPLTALLVDRARDRTLADLYLARVVRANLSADFPSAEDVRKFYDDSPDLFTLPDRLHVWQIYLPLAEGADDKAQAALEAEASKLKQLIAKGELDFAAAAEKYSGHIASRRAGGYMGLLKLEEMLPEVRTAVEALKEGAVSEPIRTSQGYHLLKRGARVPGGKLDFEEVSAEARGLLAREAATQIRKAAVEKIRAQFAVKWASEQIDDWHQRLLARDWSKGERLTKATTDESGAQAPAQAKGAGTSE